jgi:hypothetical protein
MPRAWQEPPSLALQACRCGSAGSAVMVMSRSKRDGPLAFFLTWTTYGTWLPGDERGWVAKPGQFREPDANLEQEDSRRMTQPAVTLDPKQRQLVERTIADHCQIRGWHLHVVNCLTNHVHVVVTAAENCPEEVMN